VVKESNIGLWRKKNHPIDIARMLGYYRVIARSISAVDISRVFTRFISYTPIASVASVAEAIAFREEFTTSL
jgi:hypothetical protein